MTLELLEVRKRPYNRPPLDEDFLKKQPPWTPEAIAAAGGTVERMDLATLRLRSMIPSSYELQGVMPDEKHKQPGMILEIARRRNMHCQVLKGLVIQTSSVSDQWFITFNLPDENHDEQWFSWAAGGENEMFTAGDFDRFLQRFDIRMRPLVNETRNGFRVSTYASWESMVGQ